jgi:hypothetical protein
MIEALADGIQASALSQALRASVWVYPLINTGHVLGIALLFGAIVPLDLRLLGLWRSAPLDQLTRVLVPVSVVGLVLAIATGLLLFATRPRDYVDEPLFLIKMGLLVLSVANALMFRASLPLRWKLSAAISLVLWLAVIVAGRLIGYR